MRSDHGTKSLIGQNFKQQHMRHTAVHNVHRIHATLGGVQRARDLGQHAAADRAVSKQFINPPRGQVGEQLARLIEHTADVGQHQELFSFEHGGQLGRNHVGIDVVTLIGLTEPNWADDRNEGIVLQCLDHAGVDANDIAT